MRDVLHDGDRLAGELIGNFPFLTSRTATEAAVTNLANAYLGVHQSSDQAARPSMSRR